MFKKKKENYGPFVYFYPNPDLDNWCFVFQLDASAANILKELQQKLNGVLDELSNIFAKSLEPQIQQSMQELGALLSKVKGAGQVSLSQPSQRSTIQHESDMVLRPLMDLLDGR